MVVSVYESRLLWDTLFTVGQLKKPMMLLTSSVYVTSKLVRATFKSSNLESTVTLHVHTEMDTADIPEVVELPRIECKNVLRQVGHVMAVVKDAQVEVHTNTTRGVSRCEPSDISSQLRPNIDRPIILSTSISIQTIPSLST